MGKQHWKGSALLTPLPPALVTCGSNEKPNILTIGWTGIINSQPPKTYISVRKERFSHSIISESREFVINIPTETLVRSVDFCGVRSGRDTDKFRECGLHTGKAEKVSAPVLAESPINLECRVFDIIPLGTHDMFLADIVGVDVDECLLDADGKLHIERCKPIAYSHGEYYRLGAKLGFFGYSVRRKKHIKRENIRKSGEK